MSSEAAGGQALVLILSTLVGGIYEFCGQTLKVFKDVIDFASVQLPASWAWASTPQATPTPSGASWPATT